MLQGRCRRSPLSAPVQGGVGLMMNGLQAHRDPTAIRDLRLGPLPEQLPTPEQRAAAAQQAARERVAAAHRLAQAAVARRDREQAAMQLLPLLPVLPQLVEDEAGKALVAAVDKALLAADTVHAHRCRAGREAAAGLAALAGRYAELPWPRAALEIAALAATLDPGQAGALQQAQQRVAAVIARQRAAELQAPADDGAELRRRFGDAAAASAAVPSFRFDGPAAAVTLPPGGSAVAAAAIVPILPFRAAVAVKLDVGAAAGFCLRMPGNGQYTGIVLRRGSSSLQLEVGRHEGQWQLLGARRVDVADWRRDGWFELRLQFSPAGVQASVLDHRLDVPQDLLGGGGGFGLCAFDTGQQAAGAELRAFRLLP